MYKIYTVKKNSNHLPSFRHVFIVGFILVLINFYTIFKKHVSLMTLQMRVNSPLNVITYFPNLSLSSLLKKVLKYFFKGNIGVAPHDIFTVLLLSKIITNI